MKKYKIIALAMLVCAGMKGYAQGWQCDRQGG